MAEGGRRFLFLGGGGLLGWGGGRGGGGGESSYCGRVAASTLLFYSRQYSLQPDAVFDFVRMPLTALTCNRGFTKG